jgi:pimeloyl-ACP methyl ester carboxylesterase
VLPNRSPIVAAKLEDVRQAAGGHYLALTDGIAHVRVEGAENGRPLVLLHGATVPLWEFDLLVPHLHAAGFRTLRFDLFGHGLSDRPAMSYTLELFVRQTLEILEALQFPRPATILGHSLGAAIASAVVTTYPDRADRLVLVAPMLNFNATTLWSRAFALPELGERLMRWVGVPALVRRRRERYARIGQPHLTRWFIEQASMAGYAEALTSLIRDRALGDQAARYAALRALECEVLVVAGKEDRVIPPQHIARVRELVLRHRYVEIAGAEHNLLLTHPEHIVAALDRAAVAGTRPH